MTDIDGKDVRLDKKGSEDSGFCEDMEPKLKRQKCFESSDESDKDNKLNIYLEGSDGLPSADYSKKKTTLCIDGDTKLCDIDTIKFEYRGQEYINHYATICDTSEIDGDIGIKPRDEIREVNGRKLDVENQKTVKKIFEKIKPDPTTSQIKLRLVLRRWITSQEKNEEDVYIKACDIKLELILIKKKQNEAFDEVDGGDSVIISNARYLGTFSIVGKTCTKAKPGMIDGIKLLGEKIVKIKVDEQTYMLYEDEHLHTGVLDRRASNGRNLVPDGVSTTCFCYRISAKTPEGHVFLSSNLDDQDDQGDTNVHLKTGLLDEIKTNIDERCFIEARIGNTTTLRSLIHREHFISYNKDSDKFVMKKIPMKQYKAYKNGLKSDNLADRQAEDCINAEAKLSDCLFDISLYSNQDTITNSSLNTSLFVLGSSNADRTIHSNMS